MHGFINSPALARLVALEMVDEQVRSKRGRRARTPLRARLTARRTTRSAAPVKGQRVAPTRTLAEDV